MPIFYRDNQQVCFIHVPKCGGSSIETLFMGGKRIGISERYISTRCVEYLLRHRLSVGQIWRMTAFDRRFDGVTHPTRRKPWQHLTYEELSTLYEVDTAELTFALVRNPLNRVMSAYKWQVRNKGLKEELNEWVCRVIPGLQSDPLIYDSHLRVASDFVSGPVEVFRLEDQVSALQERLQQVDPCLGQIPHINVVSMASISQNRFSKRARDLISNYYRNDFDAFY